MRTYCTKVVVFTVWMLAGVHLAKAKGIIVSMGQVGGLCSAIQVEGRVNEVRLDFGEGQHIDVWVRSYLACSDGVELRISDDRTDYYSCSWMFVGGVVKVQSDSDKGLASLVLRSIVLDHSLLLEIEQGATGFWSPFASKTMVFVLTKKFDYPDRSGRIKGPE